MLSTLLLLAVLALSGILVQIYRQKEKLKWALSRYESLTSRENVERQLDSNIHLKQNELEQLEYEQKQLSTQIKALKQQITSFEEEIYIESFGFYQSKYDFVGTYETELTQNKLRQKQMIRDNQAAICRTSITINSDEKEGQKLSKNMLKLALMIFNSECDSAISRAKSSNIAALEKRINKIFYDLNKYCNVINCEITEKYLTLKLRELDLQFRLECERKEEKIREQEIRTRMKQEEKDRRKIEEEARKIREAEAREQEYQQQLEEALRQRDFIAEQERNQLEAQIRKLRRNLEEATNDKQEAITRSAMVKAGYIYVISNVGSLGQDIYRICMTKRSTNEDEYIRSMTPEVPFPFDIHFKFISRDASKVLNQLHQRFNDRRVNGVNPRREFFKVPLEEIAQAIEEIRKETGAINNIQYERIPEAYEYRKTKAVKHRED
jgi:chromosome segregation ATPase